MRHTLLILSVLAWAGCQHQEAYLPMVRELASDYESTGKELTDLYADIQAWRDSLLLTEPMRKPDANPDAALPGRDTATNEIRTESSPTEILRRLDGEVARYMDTWQAAVGQLQILVSDLESGTRDQSLPERVAMQVAAHNEARYNLVRWQQSVRSVTQPLRRQSPPESSPDTVRPPTRQAIIPVPVADTTTAQPPAADSLYPE